MATALFRGSSSELQATLANLPAILAGRAPDPYGIARQLQLRVGVRLLSLIQADFITKARGGTGVDGITWPKLKRATIAGRRPPPHKKRGERPMGLLTDAQDKKWRKLFASKLSQLLTKHGGNLADAKARAAAFAWTQLKSEGAKTRLETLGGRTVQMLRDTGELLNSFSPGIENQPSGAEGQVFRTGPGSVIVGTNKKTWHHRGVPGRLPARPFWPEQMPPAWRAKLSETARRGLARIIRDLVSRGGRL